KLNPGSQSGLKVLREAGINTDTLIKKIPVEQLRLLEGTYWSETDSKWKIEFKEINGILTADDRGYRYKLVPVENYSFINPDDGASLVFDISNKNAVTLIFLGKIKFKKH